MASNNNNEGSIVESTSTFPENINNALQNCQQSRESLLIISNEVNDIPGTASTSIRNYCSIGLHINNALQGSIRTIGHGGNMMRRLRTMLNLEQRNELAADLHGMQREMVTTYTECHEADRELCQSLRQTVSQDPVLCSDAIAIQCVDDIEEHQNHLQSLPINSESTRERSNTIESMQSQLNLLQERAEYLNPNGPLKKLLKIFQRAFQAMNDLMKGIFEILSVNF